MNLILHVIFFTIQLGLLSLCNVTAIEFSVSLLLRVNGAILSLQLTIVTAEIPFVSIDLIVHAAISTKHFGPSWMVLREIRTSRIASAVAKIAAITKIMSTAATLTAEVSSAITAAVSPATIAGSLVLMAPVKILSCVCGVFTPVVLVSSATVFETASVAMVPALCMVETTATASSTAATQGSHVLLNLLSSLFTTLHRLLMHLLCSLGAPTTSASASTTTTTVWVIVFSVRGK